MKINPVIVGVREMRAQQMTIKVRTSRPLRVRVRIAGWLLHLAAWLLAIKLEEERGE